LAGVIDGIITRLDQGWLESAKIHDFLRKHHGFYSPGEDIDGERKKKDISDTE